VADEKLCVRCGRCCNKKAEQSDGSLQFTVIPCQHQDPGSKLCKVYNERDKVPWCVSVEKAIEKRVLPNDCPYVQGIEGYKGPAPAEPHQPEAVDLMAKVMDAGDTIVSAPDNTKTLDELIGDALNKPRAARMQELVSLTRPPQVPVTFKNKGEIRAHQRIQALLAKSRERKPKLRAVVGDWLQATREAAQGATP